MKDIGELEFDEEKERLEIIKKKVSKQFQTKDTIYYFYSKILKWDEMLVS